MSKKWKNKLKKQQKARLLQEAVGTLENQITPPSSSVPSTTYSIEAQKSSGKTKQAKESAAISSATLLPEVTRVKHDIRKISYIMLSIFILLTAAVIMDRKANWLLKTADLLFSKL